MLGGGLPEAVQSNQAPLEFENSILDGGSSTKLGPRKCASKPCPFADVTIAAAPAKRTVFFYEIRLRYSKSRHIEFFFFFLKQNIGINKVAGHSSWEDFYLILW